jgi:hypothetical protein
MALLAIPLGIASAVYAETHPVVAWLLGGGFVATALIGHAVVVWKMERDYRRP